MNPTPEQIAANPPGDERPIGPQFHGRYVGRRFPNLYGQTAIVCKTRTGGTCAQFDNYDTGRALGWHAFRACDFAVIDDVYDLSNIERRIATWLATNPGTALAPRKHGKVSELASGYGCRTGRFTHKAAI